MIAGLLVCQHVLPVNDGSRSRTYGSAACQRRNIRRTLGGKGNSRSARINLRKEQVHL